MTVNTTARITAALPLALALIACTGSIALSSETETETVSETETETETTDPGRAAPPSPYESEDEHTTPDEPPPPCARGFSRDDSNRCAMWTLPLADWPTFDEHTATLLLDGRVLVVGHVVGASEANAALFDPVSDSWTLLPDAPPARRGHTTTRLADGRALVVGGIDADQQTSAQTALFDPATEAWTSLPSMATARVHHSAVLLPNGHALVAGGRSQNGTEQILRSVEDFDPATSTWSPKASLLEPRERHTANLTGGEVRIVGGVGLIAGIPESLSTSEIYAPQHDLWTAGEELPGGAIAHTTTTLTSGALLIVSNSLGAHGWHPLGHFWPTTAMHAPRSNHVAVRLRDDRVLAAGGTPYQDLATPEIYDPTTDTWSTTLDHPFPIWNGTATLLDDNRILIIGPQATTFQLAP